MAGHFKSTQVPRAFPKLPQFSEFMKPCRFEGEIRSLEVRGEIPHEIDGTFYRVMPDPQFPSFIENDPVGIPCLALVYTHYGRLMDIKVVQWRRKYQRISNKRRTLPLQAAVCKNGKVC